MTDEPEPETPAAAADGEVRGRPPMMDGIERGPAACLIGSCTIQVFYPSICLKCIGPTTCLKGIGDESIINQFLSLIQHIQNRYCRKSFHFYSVHECSWKPCDFSHFTPSIPLQVPVPLATLAQEVTDHARVQLRLLLAAIPGASSSGRMREMLANIGQPPEAAGGVERISFWVAVMILSLHPAVSSKVTEELLMLWRCFTLPTLSVEMSLHLY